MTKYCYHHCPFPLPPTFLSLSPSGRGDRVQCYYCDGGLKNWDPSDEPWEEHAKWFGDCGFLRIVKGSQFVEEVQRRKQGEDPLEYLEEDLDDKEMQVSEQVR